MSGDRSTLVLQTTLNFKLMVILLHLPPKCWDNRGEPLAFSLKSLVLTLGCQRHTIRGWSVFMKIHIHSFLVLLGLGHVVTAVLWFLLVSDGDSAPQLCHRAGYSRRQPLCLNKWVREIQGLGKEHLGVRNSLILAPDGHSWCEVYSLEEKVLQRRFLQRGFILWETHNWTQ